MMTSSLSHHVTIDSRFINLFMSVVILEGVGRQLYKNLDIVGTALPVIMYSVPEYGEVGIMNLLDCRLQCRLFEKANSQGSHCMCHFIRTSKKLVNRFMDILEDRRKKNLFKKSVWFEYCVQFVDIEPKEDVDYREATLLSLYDRVEKSQVV